jgi:hypothetical protein
MVRSDSPARTGTGALACILALRIKAMLACAPPRKPPEACPRRTFARCKEGLGRKEELGIPGDRAFTTQVDEHLGAPAEEDVGNHRNGYGSKTMLADTGKLELSIPHDRHGRFDQC